MRTDLKIISSNHPRQVTVASAQARTRTSRRCDDFFRLLAEKLILAQFPVCIFSLTDAAAEENKAEADLTFSHLFPFS